MAHDGPIYAAMAEHLRGAPGRPYDAGLGDVIARVSRVAEPIVGPWIADTVRGLAPRRVLDVGCGTGVNLRWMARAAPAGATLVGVDVDPDAAEAARDNIRTWGLDGVTTRQADLHALPPDLTSEPWDLVLLAQNIYYWPVEERSAVLARLRDLAGPAGTVVAITAVPTRMALVRNLDLVLRVIDGCGRLPTREELHSDATAAGFGQVSVRDIIPGGGMAALVARG